MLMKFFRVRENAIIPQRANPSDAGCDVFYCPNENSEFGDVKGNSYVGTFINHEIRIKPGQNAIIPTGLKFSIPHNFALMVCNRSSFGAKKSLVYGAHVIDSGYAGEVFIDLHNIGTETQVINSGDKIAQLVLVPVISFQPLEAQKEEELYDIYPITISNRGAGALGSTDVKNK